MSFICSVGYPFLLFSETGLRVAQAGLHYLNCLGFLSARMAEMYRPTHLCQDIVFFPPRSPGAVPTTRHRNHQSWSGLSPGGRRRQVQTGGVRGWCRTAVLSWHLGHLAATLHPEQRDPGQLCVVAGWGHGPPAPWAKDSSSS